MKFISLLQVLEESGLNKYVDARYVQQELAEATDMTREQMDQAARDLLRRTSVPGPGEHGKVRNRDPSRRREENIFRSGVPE